MRASFLSLCATIMAVVGLHAFRAFQDTVITGKITPAEAVAGIMAINEKDTVRGEAKEGVFTLKVKPGAWKIVIGANEPYKNAVLERVYVKEGANIDVGAIRLEQ